MYHSNQILILIIGFICLGFIKAQITDNICYQSIVSVFKEFSSQQDLDPQAQSLLYNAGKEINDLGNYYGCIQEGSDTRYYKANFMFILNRTIPFPKLLGLCLPNECTMDQLNNMAPQIVKNINQKLVANQKGPTSLLVKDITYYNPLNSPQWTFGDIMTVLLFLFLFFLGTYGSYLQIRTEAYEAKQKMLQENIQTKPRRENIFIRIVKCFSFYNNIPKLFHIQQSGDNSFELFQGFRVLMISWVIYGHDFWIRYIQIRNWTDQQNFVKEAGWFTLVPAAYFSVDSFFYMAGFLGTIVALDKFAHMKRINPLLYIQLIVHRLFRIWPTYMVALMVLWHLLYHMGSGPIWSNAVYQNQICDKNGWQNMLFIDNLYSHGYGGYEYCFGWGWYLSNDIQFFLITPLLWFAFHFNKVFGVLLNTALFIASCNISYTIVNEHNYHINYPIPNGPEQPNFMDTYYYKPWVRIGPYLIGIYIGFFYRAWKTGNTICTKIVNLILDKAIVRWIMWIFGFAIMNALVWCLIPIQKDYYNWTESQHHTYTAFAKCGFVVGLALLFLPTMLGNKDDWVGRFLGAKFWTPLARVSFCTYLIHFIVIFQANSIQKQLMYYDIKNILFFVLCDIFLSFFFGGILSMLIEAPTLNLEKIIMPQRERPPASKDTNKEQLLSNEDKIKAEGSSEIKIGDNKV